MKARIPQVGLWMAGVVVVALVSAWVGAWYSDRHEAAKDPAHITVLTDLNDLDANNPYD